MSREQFAAILPYICADLIYMIISQKKVTEEDAILKLYTSKLYEVLEKEDTKLWHYSTKMLYSLLEQEEKTGIIRYPDV
jgi:hypothetical protein